MGFLITLYVGAWLLVNESASFVGFAVAMYIMFGLVTRAPR